MDFNWQYVIEMTVLLGIAISIIIGLLALLIRIKRWQWLENRQTVWLELTPPASVEKSLESVQKLMVVLHSFSSSRSYKNKLLSRPVVITPEVRGNKASGIRYYIQVDKRLSNTFQQTIHAHLSSLKIAEVTAPASNTYEHILSFKQTGAYPFSLAEPSSFDEHDPAAFIASAMTNLFDDEEMIVQLTMEPVRLKDASILQHRIKRHEDVLSQLSRRGDSRLGFVSRIINSILFFFIDAITMTVHSSSGYSSAAASRGIYEKQQIAQNTKPARSLSSFEQQQLTSVYNKVSQPLFRVSIRVGISTKTNEETTRRADAIKAAFMSLSALPYQSLQPRKNLPLLAKLQRHAFNYRLPSLLKRNDNTLSASEIASIFHFPLGENNQTDNLVTSLSRTLPAPISLKQDKHLDVIIGQNEHHGTKTAIGLTTAEREHHVYIIGGTGNGKTTMLQYAITQDMTQGKGLAVVDPHGDMAETLLRQVPPHRIKDVVYFNPDDIGYPIGLNLLELPEGLNSDELIREKDLITESVISVFRKIFSEEDTGRHRIEYILRNTIQTALTLPEATLFTVFDLLNDTKFRKSVLKKLDNKDLRNFWKNEIGKAGDMQKVKMAAGITAKIGRFLFSASAKRILEQPKSTIDFDDIINNGKILICNFSKGLIGEDTSELFGITILAKLQLASLRRARIRQNERQPFYLYVDEFQNFATQSFVQMLSESRKYKMFMMMAEQSTSQQKDQQMVDIILANVSTIICFRTGNPQDERLLLPLFSPYVDPGEISNLSPFNFYAKLSAIQAQEPLSGRTLLLESEGSNQVAAATIENSRITFAKRENPLKPDDLNETKPDKKGFFKRKPPTENQEPLFDK
jgi:hypothetical protein